jgi:hypothetical protein
MPAAPCACVAGIPALADCAAELPAVEAVDVVPVPALAVIAALAAFAPAADGCDDWPAAADLPAVIAAAALDMAALDMAALGAVLIVMLVLEAASPCPSELCDEQAEMMSSHAPAV